jgi:diaminopimelate epimerase
MLKGHGTGNDFVLIPDSDGSIDLSAEQVRRLCDRHTGIGGDGVLRVVRVALDAEARALSGADGSAADAEWFMDYRNADGSIAEMCGNGVRVFAQYLLGAGLISDSVDVLTRGGVRPLRRVEAGWSVGMGQAHLLTSRPLVRVGAMTREAIAALEIPNPHVVVQLADCGELDALDLMTAPDVSPALPHGQNVEFVVQLAPGHITMRVHERGVGETLSCGTGICAAVVAMAHSQAELETSVRSWRVDVPGGTCWVDIDADGEVLLTGPAVIVAELSIDPLWLES